MHIGEWREEMWESKGEVVAFGRSSCTCSPELQPQQKLEEHTAHWADEGEASGLQIEELKVTGGTKERHATDSPYSG